jgi:hypothetical protein
VGAAEGAPTASALESVDKPLNAGEVGLAAQPTIPPAWTENAVTPTTDNMTSAQKTGNGGAPRQVSDEKGRRHQCNSRLRALLARPHVSMLLDTSLVEQFA